MVGRDLLAHKDALPTTPAIFYRSVDKGVYWFFLLQEVKSEFAACISHIVQLYVSRILSIPLSEVVLAVRRAGYVDHDENIFSFPSFNC